MPYSAIVPFHSNVNLLQACLYTLHETLPNDAELIVVVNNTRAEPLPAFPASTRVLTFRDNLGYAGAVNVGAEAANGKTLIFCDADTLYFGAWLPALAACMRTHPLAAITASKHLDFSTGRIADFGHAFTGYNFAHLDLDRRPDANIASEDREVQSVCSATMMVARSHFRQLGGFDEALFNYYSDVDLCLRVRANGGEVWCASNSLVYHRGNSTLDGRSAYRADVKGRFMAANAARLREDMEAHLRRRLERFLAENALAGSYLLIDLTSVANRHWFHGILGDYFPIIDTYEYRMETRDAAAIDFVLLLGLDVALMRVPLLLFVDRFRAISYNDAWFRLRDSQHDVVVDRHGTVVTVQHVLQGIA